MIIKLKKEITKDQMDHIIEVVKTFNCSIEHIQGTQDLVLGIIGNTTAIDIKMINQLPGVIKVTRISAPYKLVSREYTPLNSVVKVGNITIGDGNLIIMGGPCSIESKEQLDETVAYLKETNTHILRGGIVKPRTSPYAFQGMEEAGLELMEAVREKTGLPIVCELMSVEQVERFGTRVDMIQIGARNMQNFDLLKAVGTLPTPILLKRGLSATIEEWLMSAEYIAANGNLNIVLCERGIRTFETAYRNVADLNAIPYLKTLTHLPVIVDPSHATGKDWMVEPLAQAAVAVGADGIMLETHYNPQIALSDGPQSLDEPMYRQTVQKLHDLHQFLQKQNKKF